MRTEKAETIEPPLNPEELILVEYKNAGIDMLSRELISSLDEQESKPIAYTHELWYSKTKTMLPSIISSEIGIDPKEITMLSTSIDVLWTLSVMVDDIYDQDTHRRSKPAAWTVFGAEQTYKSAQAGFEDVLQILAKHYGVKSAQLCKSSVERGLQSIKDHKFIELSCGFNQLVENYGNRDAFFARFPFEALSIQYPESAKQLEDSAIALEKYYFAGQIGNDLDDMFKEVNGNCRYSDVKSGLVTVPTRILWEKMTESDKESFLEIFDTKELTEIQNVILNQLKYKYSVFDRSFEKIVESYTESIKILQPILREPTLEIFNGLCKSQLQKFSKYKAL